MSLETSLTPPTLHEAHVRDLRRRIGWIVHAMRWGAAAYVILDVWTNGWMMTHRELALAGLAHFAGVRPASLPSGAYLALAAGCIVFPLLAIPVALALWRLLRCYLDGEIFTAGATAKLRRLALIGLAAIAAVAVTNCAIAAVAVGDPFVPRVLYVALNPNNLLLALFCCFLLLLAAVFKAAAEIADEHKHFA
jgi:hypothetical protein